MTETRRRNLRQALATDEELREIFERTYGIREKTMRRGPVNRKTKEDIISPESMLRNEEIKQKHLQKKGDPGERKADLLIIDGYNLINCSTELRKLANSDLGAAREQLVDQLINYRGYMNCELVVVFDAYLVPSGMGSTEQRLGVRTVFTRAEEPADIFIGRLVDEEGKNRSVRVVSSDALVQQNALGHDADRISSREFLEEMSEVEKEIRTMLEEL